MSSDPVGGCGGSCVKIFTLEFFLPSSIKIISHMCYAFASVTRRARSHEKADRMKTISGNLVYHTYFAKDFSLSRDLELTRERIAPNIFSAAIAIRLAKSHLHTSRPPHALFLIYLLLVSFRSDKFSFFSIEVKGFHTVPVPFLICCCTHTFFLTREDSCLGVSLMS